MAYITQNSAGVQAPVRTGVIGSGWMGAFHAESIARRALAMALACIESVKQGAPAAVAASTVDYAEEKS
ncbi:hypothetical protein TV39_03860 [Arthrobacter sp. SPG23]|uniref:hypothetical protein n=1 Tax=Arthrobacter sp. SPG23 TaxID=1610703 RepID=UPI0005BDEC91|nr:hypothetical protein [Arthrobacter sp. SPG23]KIS28554.1 hypothetical protein TV39_03860 [Arthrobacter sp. SPG23]